MKRQLKELLALSNEMVQITIRGAAPVVSAASASAASALDANASMRLVLKPVTAFSKRFTIHAGSDVLGDLTLGGAKGTKARIVLDREVYEVCRDPRDGALLLERQGLPEAQAVKTSVWKHAYDVEYSGGRFRFGRPAGDERSFEAEADGQRVAFFYKPTFFSRRIEAEVPDTWPVPFALFLAALALTAWNDT